MDIGSCSDGNGRIAPVQHSPTISLVTPQTAEIQVEKAYYSCQEQDADE